jgi:predicted MFS family arabinose efflux permease
MLGLTEAAIGLGSTCGPVIGGFLFAYGGFSMPVGAVACLAVVLASLCVAFHSKLKKPAPSPDTKEEEPDEEDEDENDFDGRREPDMWTFGMTLSGVFLCGFLTASYKPLVSAHVVNEYGWRMKSLGLLFGSYGVSYTTTSVVVGRWCGSSRTCCKRCFASGPVVASLAMLLGGGLQYPPSSAVLYAACLIVGTLLLGVADALLLVPSLLVVRQCVPPGSLANSSLVALDQGLFALGSAAGPMVMLQIGEIIGFQSAMVGAALPAMVVGTIVTHLLLCRRQSPSVVREVDIGLGPRAEDEAESLEVCLPRSETDDV